MFIILLLLFHYIASYHTTNSLSLSYTLLGTSITAASSKTDFKMDPSYVYRGIYSGRQRQYHESSDSSTSDSETSSSSSSSSSSGDGDNDDREGEGKGGRAGGDSEKARAKKGRAIARKERSALRRKEKEEAMKTKVCVYVRDLILHLFLSFIFKMSLDIFRYLKRTLCVFICL